MYMFYQKVCIHVYYNAPDMFLAIGKVVVSDLKDYIHLCVSDLKDCIHLCI